MRTNLFILANLLIFNRSSPGAFLFICSTKVHSDYADCAVWIGDMILSKSTENRVILWVPDTSRNVVSDDFISSPDM